MPATPLIFDLDGTLVDSVYLHVAAFQRALCEAHVDIPLYEVHKRVGMTGELMLHALSDAFDLRLDQAQITAIDAAHTRYYRELNGCARPVPGARDVWQALDARDVPYAVVTSAGKEDADDLLAAIAYPKGAIAITKDDDAPSKPAPDAFERAARRLHVPLKEAIIVGDSVWDMMASRRARALGIGVLTGGYGQQELEAAGAFRVYRDIADMTKKLDELGL